MPTGSSEPIAAPLLVWPLTEQMKEKDPLIAVRIEEGFANYLHRDIDGKRQRKMK